MIVGLDTHLEGKLLMSDRVIDGHELTELQTIKKRIDIWKGEIAELRTQIKELHTIAEQFDNRRAELWRRYQTRYIDYLLYALRYYKRGVCARCQKFFHYPELFTLDIGSLSWKMDCTYDRWQEYSCAALPICTSCAAREPKLESTVENGRLIGKSIIGFDPVVQEEWFLRDLSRLDLIAQEFLIPLASPYTP